jgi:MGT family glycosyltransferase
VSRIVLVTGPDAGHALPVMAIAAALAGRGHDVALATGPDYDDAAEAAGVSPIGLPLLAPTDQDADMGYRLWGKAVDMAPALVERITDAGGADLVIADTLTTAGRFAAELLDVPWVETSPHHLMDPSEHLPPIGLGRPPARTPWRRRDDRRLRARQARSLAEGVAQRDQARARLGLHGPSPDPVIRLLGTIPGLEHPRPDWPDDAHIVGPLEWEPEDWPDLEPPPGDQPLVLVTDSTATTVARSLAEVAIDALGPLDVRVVVTTGRDDLHTPPGVVAGRGRHIPLLRAAQVAVCPGGHGFVTKALARGVPLVVIPLQGDQRETAARVEHAGAGRAVAPRRLTARKLRRAVDDVLRTHSYGRAAQRMATDAAGRGADHAAHLVEEVLAGRVPAPDPRARRHLA